MALKSIHVNDAGRCQACWQRWPCSVAREADKSPDSDCYTIPSGECIAAQCKLHGSTQAIITEEELAELQGAHVRVGMPQTNGSCRTCLNLWPCPTSRLIAYLRATREQLKEWEVLVPLVDRINELETDLRASRADEKSCQAEVYRLSLLNSDMQDDLNRLRKRLDEAQLRDIEARNPGINIEEVKDFRKCPRNPCQCGHHRDKT